MFFYEGQSCPVCGRAFAETDDIVACPECGAPHHRECWKTEGHCHFADAHGTEHQWAKEVPPSQTAPQNKCPNCGRENPEFAEFCAHCGRALGDTDWHSEPAHTPPPVNQYTPPFQQPFVPPHMHDPLGGVPRSETIEGISVETVAEVIGPNASYYLPRFMKMSRTGKKVSWNLSAFLLPYNWLLFRKNLLIGWLVFAFYTAVSFFFSKAYADLLPLMNDVSALLSPSTETMALMLAFELSFAVMTVLRVLLGLFGNWLYMRLVLKKARKLQENPDLHYNQSFLSTGGTSLAMGALPQILLLFVQYIGAILLTI